MLCYFSIIPLWLNNETARSILYQWSVTNWINSTSVYNMLYRLKKSSIMISFFPCLLKLFENTRPFLRKHIIPFNITAQWWDTSSTTNLMAVFRVINAVFTPVSNTHSVLLDQVTILTYNSHTLGKCISCSNNVPFNGQRNVNWEPTGNHYHSRCESIYDPWGRSNIHSNRS